MIKNEKQALEKSIIHWWQNWFILYMLYNSKKDIIIEDQNDLYTLEDFGYSCKPSMCALCIYHKQKCQKCIIGKKSTSNKCINTPYYYTPYDNLHLRNLKQTDVKACLDEYKFLCNLMEK